MACSVHRWRAYRIGLCRHDVLHDDDMHRWRGGSGTSIGIERRALLDRVHAKEAHQQGVGVLLHVLQVVQHDASEEHQLLWEQRFDDVLAIVGGEEEAATLASTSHATQIVRLKRLLQRPPPPRCTCVTTKLTLARQWHVPLKVLHNIPKIQHR
jgi:hypothetical protein